jgi:hypothetical protein
LAIAKIQAEIARIDAEKYQYAEDVSTVKSFGNDRD